MKKKKTGRPTKLTGDTVRKLEDAFKHGATVIEACYLSGISRDTFYRHYKADDGFSDKMDRSRGWLSILAKRNIAIAVLSGDIKVSLWLEERHNNIPTETIGDEMPLELKKENEEELAQAMEDYVQSRIRESEYQKNLEERISN